MIIKSDLSGTKLRSPTPGVDCDMTVDIFEHTHLITPGTEGEQVINDAYAYVTTDAVTENHFHISVNAWQETSSNQITPTIECTENGIVEGLGVERVNDGPVDIFVKIPWITKKFSKTFARTTSTTYQEVISWQPGSLAAHMYDQFYSRITPLSQMNIFSVLNGASSIRNPQCWAYNIDMSPLAVWNSVSATFSGGLLVAPDISLHAAHYGVSPGQSLTFMTTDNQAVTKTITAVQNVTNTDIQVAKLDSDVSNIISVAKVFPSNLIDYLPSLGVFDVPGVLASDYEKKAIAKQITEGVDYTTSQIMSFTECDDFRAVVSEPTISGDSGSPICCVVNGHLVALSVWTTAIAGYAYHKFISEINAVISALGSSHELTIIDLSPFATY